MTGQAVRACGETARTPATALSVGTRGRPWHRRCPDTLLSPLEM